MKSHKNLLNIYIPILLFSIAFLWKFYYINTRDVCLDEPFTIFHAQKSVVDVLKLPAQNEPNPPLFMFFLHFWMMLFGNGPYSVRLLPLLFNAATPIFIYFTGKKLLNVWSGLLASGLFILSTYHFYFGLETRAYSMLSFATSAALYFFISLANSPGNKRYLWGLIISNILMIYSHYFGWFVVFAQVILSLFYLKDKRVFRPFIISLLATGISFIPMRIIFIKQFLISIKGTWVTPPCNSEYLNQLKQFLNTSLVLKVVLIVCAIGILLAAIKKIERQKIKELIIIFLWWITPYSIMFFTSSKIPMFINRYVLFNTIGLYVFIGLFISLTFDKIKFLTPIFALLILSLMFLKLEINSKHFYYREVQNAVNHVKHHVDSNTIIFIHPHWANLGFTYYYDREIFQDINNYEERLTENSIFPVWNVNFVKEIIKTKPRSKIVYYQDGSVFNDKNNTIFQYFDSTYNRIDSVFFPQCLYVSAFMLKE